MNLDVHFFPYFSAVLLSVGFLGGWDGKESACSVGDLGVIPRLGRSPGGGHGNSLQCSGLENPMDRGAWWATVHGFANSRTWLSSWAQHTLLLCVSCPCILLGCTWHRCCFFWWCPVTHIGFLQLFSSDGIISNALSLLLSTAFFELSHYIL